MWKQKEIDMSLMPSNKEKLRAELDKLKSLKGKKLWEYIWEYYKLVIIGILIIFAILGSTIYSSIANPTPVTVLNVAWIHQPQLPEFYEHVAAQLKEALTEYNRNETVHVFTFVGGGNPQFEMAMQMRFAAMIATADLDVVITDRSELEDKAMNGMLKDISSLPPVNTESLLIVESGYNIPSVYGVSILNSQVLANASMFVTDDCPVPYVGIFINTNRPEKAKQAIELLLE